MPLDKKPAIRQKKLVNPTSFKAGNSGNPTGRPKRTEEELDLMAACKLKCVAALEVIERLMTSARSDAVQLNAAAFVIERAYGKAVVHTDNKHSGTMGVNLSVEQAKRIAQEVLSGGPK